MNPLSMNEVSPAPVEALHGRHPVAPQVPLPSDVFEVTEDSSLVDFQRARDAGIPLSQVAPFFKQILGEFEGAGHSLYRRNILSTTSSHATVFYPREGVERDMIMLASNNYLGLADHPKVMEAARDAITQYGTGMCSAPLLVGTMPLTNQLEAKIAAFKGTEEAIVFSTGYSANLGVISSLVTKNDLVIMDRLSHASIIDGAKLSGAKVRVFRHNDAAHLDQILSRNTDHSLRLVVVEGLYSMDGDIAPLPDIVEVCEKHNAMLIVDEAHTLGVLGPKGEGSVAHFGLKGRVALQIGTMSKTLACTGGFACGSSELITYIRYFGRSYMFSAAPTPAALATANAAIDAIINEPELRERLWHNTHYLYNGLAARGFRLSDVPSPIIAVIVGKMSALRQMTLELHQKNICVNSIPYPAVSHGEERLRLSVTAKHTDEQLQHVIEMITEVGKNAGVI